jgi:hypothetical protein
VTDTIVEDVAALLHKRGDAFVFEHPPDLVSVLRSSTDRVADIDALSAFAHFLATTRSSPAAARVLMTQLESALGAIAERKP